MKIKRFVLMGGDIYYAEGGFQDFLSSFATKEEAEKAQTDWDKEHVTYSWSHITDLEEGTISGSAGYKSPIKMLRDIG